MDFKIPKHFTGDHIELLNSEIEKSKPKEIILHISEIENAGLFANSRLLSLLLKCSQSGIPIIIQTAKQSSDFFAKKKNQNFFVDLATGFISAFFSKKIIDETGDDYTDVVLRKQTETLSSTLLDREFSDGKRKIIKEKGVIVKGNEYTAFYLEGFNRPEKANIFKQLSEVDAEHIPRFISNFFIPFRSLGLDIKNRNHVSTVQRIASNIGFEAVQNIREHAIRDLEGVSLNLIQFVHFNRIHLGPHSHTSASLVTDEMSPIGKYIQSVQNKFPDKAYSTSIFEVSFSDCGTGIPARLSGSMDIYKGSIENEKAQLLKALQEGVSSKPKKNLDAGFGFPKILQAAKLSQGLIVFRTGRLLMYRNFLENQEDQIDKLFDWDSVARSYLPGTSINLLFPIHQRTQVEQTKLF